MAGDPKAPLPAGTNPQLDVPPAQQAHKVAVREREPGRRDDETHHRRLTRLEREPQVAKQLLRRTGDPGVHVVPVPLDDVRPRARGRCQSRATLATNAPPASTLPPTTRSACSNLVYGGPRPKGRRVRSTGCSRWAGRRAAGAGPSTAGHRPIAAGSRCDRGSTLLTRDERLTDGGAPLRPP